MDANEARILLGFPPNSRPTSSQVKAAYKKKVWESHPDLFPSHEKPLAESKFKRRTTSNIPLVATSVMNEDIRSLHMPTIRWERRSFKFRTRGGSKNHAMIKVPFILIILGTIGLGGFHATRAYKKQKEEYPSHNPFLP